MTTIAFDLTANLARARKALGALIAAQPDAATDTRHEWAAFYDALQFIPGVEDAAADALADALCDMCLDGDGYQDNGDSWDDHQGEREYTPMTPIFMPPHA